MKPDQVITELVNSKQLEEVPESAFGNLVADQMAVSAAISAKRQADALERIAKAAERLATTEYKGAILTQERGR